ncbi:MAG: RtcB family protein [Anaerolineales bacterium]|nr:RtcB family protein [Anaerolineales bacterium]
MKTQKTQKTHKLLDNYRHLTNFPEIAQAAARWAKANPQATPAELLARVEASYGVEQWLTVTDKPAPFAMFGEPGAHIPYNAVEQMEMVMRLPVARRGALMPDAHLGYAMPIGGVVSMAGVISPSFVGYDISCMMQLSLFDLTPAQFMAERRQLAAVLRDETSFGLGADFKSGQRRHAVMDDLRWKDTKFLGGLKAKAGQQLGSSGGGNHFADLMLVDFVRDHEGYRAGAQAVGLLTHSGSRGAGYKTATHYVGMAAAYTRQIARKIPNGYEWLALDAELGQEYLSAMQLMGAYARQPRLDPRSFRGRRGIGTTLPGVEPSQLRLGGGRRRHPSQGGHASRTGNGRPHSRVEWHGFVSCARAGQRGEPALIFARRRAVVFAHGGQAPLRRTGISAAHGCA